MEIVVEEDLSSDTPNIKLEIIEGNDDKFKDSGMGFNEYDRKILLKFRPIKIFTPYGL
jgi:hypothetical protein